MIAGEATSAREGVTTTAAVAGDASIATTVDIGISSSSIITSNHITERGGGSTTSCDDGGPAHQGVNKLIMHV
jgi:hypothetical protein